MADLTPLRQSLDAADSALDDLRTKLEALDDELNGEEPPPDEEVPDTYTVVAGDTLRALAARFGVTVEDLADWNDIADPNRIHVGDVLVLHVPADEEPPPDEEPPGEEEPPPPGDDGQTAAAVLGWNEPTWRDEFDYSGAPNPAKWQNAPERGMPGHSGNGRRVGYCTTVADGAMTLHGYPNGDTAWVRQKLPTKYGRWEIRSRSRNVGTSGSLYHVLHLIWPTSERWPDDGEYDWLEYSNPDQQSAEAYLHYPHRNMPVQQEHAVKNGVDMTGWHNFAFQWDENGLTGWIDGVQWFHYADGAGRGGRRNIQDMPEGYLTCQLDNFHGSGMREALFEIAWVRFWEV